MPDHTPANVQVPVPEDDRSAHPSHGVDDRQFAGQPVAASKHGLRLPKFGLGTYRLEGDECRSIVAESIALGVRHIDTAQAYANEADVAAGIESAQIPRDEIFITTKIDDDSHEPADLLASVEASLERLGTDHVDLLLVHWPVEWEIIGATLNTLAQVHAGGMARHIGVSNFTIDQLEQVSGIAPLEVLQVECHPFLQQRELRGWCADAGWLFTAYSPIARGAVFDDETLVEIASAHSVSPSAVALAWLLADEIVTVIPKTSEPEHLRANLDALHVELTDDEMTRIDALDRGRRLIDPDHAPW